LLYKLDKLYVPKGKRLQLIKKAHTSKAAGHLGVGETVANLQRYVYYPKMKEYVAQYIRGCMPCCTSKPSNMKQGLHHPLPIPTRPWEIISMDCFGGLITIMKGHDYMFVVVDRFSNMCILVPCKNTIKGQETTNMFFE
jgi:hypothetical protein